VQEDLMPNIYTDANTVEREHMMGLATQLTDEDLGQPLPSGWTVSGVFAHLAWWDIRGLTLLRLWAARGITPSPIDTHLINEVTRQLCVAIPPRAAVQMALDAAAAIDDEIAHLDAAFLQQVEANGTTVHLDRAAHRRAHLQAIEQALHL
jgi:hypothetical protein